MTAGLLAPSLIEGLLRSGNPEAMGALREFEETLALAAEDLRAPLPAHVKASVLTRIAAPREALRPSTSARLAGPSALPAPGGRR